jgi:hypothetical protein
VGALRLESPDCYLSIGCCVGFLMPLTWPAIMHAPVLCDLRSSSSCVDAIDDVYQFDGREDLSVILFPASACPSFYLSCMQWSSLGLGVSDKR